MRSGDKTIQSVFNLWFWNFQNASLQQYSNLYAATVSIAKLKNKEGKYSVDIKRIKELYFTPVEKLKELYPELEVPKNPLDWDIPKLEWCYYRDTQFKVQLSEEYFLDARKKEERKKLLLGQLISVLSLFKQELYKVMIKILINEEIDISITLPGSRAVEQLGGDDIAKSNN